MKRITRVLALATVVVMVAVACGSNDSSSGSGTAPPGGGPAPSASVAPSRQFKLPKPVKIVALASSAGEDPFAVADFNDATRMAIDEINAAGGLGGHPIQFESIPTPPYGDITNQANQAVSKNPTVILGPNSSTTLLTITDKINEAGIPLIHDASDKDATLDGPQGSEWVFAVRPLNGLQATAAADFVAKDLEAEKVGVLYMNAAFGKEGNAAINRVLEQNGVEVSVDTPYAPKQTDFTQEVQSVNDTDAVIEWGVPTSLLTTVKTFAQQGLLDTPHMGGPGSLGFASFYERGVEDKSILDNVYGPVDCNPVGSDRPTVQDWVKRFDAKFGYLPSYAAAEMYDTMYMLRQIIEKAETADPTTIRDGLAAINYRGICTNYSDKYHDNVLNHSSDIIRFEDGMPTTVKHYDDLRSLQ